MKDKEGLSFHIERLHNCKVTDDVGHSFVKETFDDQLVWEGLVHIFTIQGHPDTDTCYAWSSPIEGSDKRKIYAVLKVPPIDSPEKAVRAAIVSDYKDRVQK